MASSAFYKSIKRTRNDDLDSDSDNEPFVTNDTWPRLTVMFASEKKPFSKLSPFEVQKDFQAIAGTLKSTKRLRRILPRRVLQELQGRESVDNNNFC